MRHERHEMLVIGAAGRRRLLRESLATHPATVHSFLADLFAENGTKKTVPGIVRRSEEIEKRGEDEIAVGFVHRRSLNGGRLKVAAFVCEEEIEASIEPYALMKEKIAQRNGAARAFAEIAEFPAAREGRIGVVGSVAMEIVTGVPYTNAASDLDLLIKNACYEESKAWYRQFVAAGGEYGVAVDVEVVLANGYGVKAAELFSHISHSSTVLGKSLRDVKLLDRQAVSDAMLARK